MVIGSDCITHDAESMTAAFDALTAAGTVFQPTADGGYALVGQSQYEPAVFDNIAWGTAEVWQQTVARAMAVGADLAVRPQTFDVDTVADLARLRAFLKAAGRPRTSVALARMG
jgi:glycosyltransferase A (GT-A) superfamily protein (DUF2064 family)